MNGASKKKLDGHKPTWLNPNSNNKQSELNLQKRSKSRIQKLLDDPLGKLKGIKPTSGHHHHHHHNQKKV